MYWFLSFLLTRGWLASYGFRVDIGSIAKLQFSPTDLHRNVSPSIRQSAEPENSTSNVAVNSSASDLLADARDEPISFQSTRTIVPNGSNESASMTLAQDSSRTVYYNSGSTSWDDSSLRDNAESNNATQPSADHENDTSDRETRLESAEGTTSQVQLTSVITHEAQSAINFSGTTHPFEHLHKQIWAQMLHTPFKDKIDEQLFWATEAVECRDFVIGSQESKNTMFSYNQYSRAKGCKCIHKKPQEHKVFCEDKLLINSRKFSKKFLVEQVRERECRSMPYCAEPGSRNVHVTRPWQFFKNENAYVQMNQDAKVGDVYLKAKDFGEVVRVGEYDYEGSDDSGLVQVSFREANKKVWFYPYLKDGNADPRFTLYPWAQELFGKFLGELKARQRDDDVNAANDKERRAEIKAENEKPSSFLGCPKWHREGCKGDRQFGCACRNNNDCGPRPHEHCNGDLQDMMYKHFITRDFRMVPVSAPPQQIPLNQIFSSQQRGRPARSFVVEVRQEGYNGERKIYAYANFDKWERSWRHPDKGYMIEGEKTGWVGDYNSGHASETEEVGRVYQKCCTPYLRRK